MNRPPDPANPRADRSAHRRLGLFYLLTIVLSVPFLILGSATGASLLPGLPIAALMAVCPGLAAMILVGRDEGRAGARALARRAFDARRVRGAAWYIPVLLLAPLQYALAVAALRLLGVGVPAPSFDAVRALLLCLMFFVGALAEELGWTGYATEPLIDRFGVVKAGLIVGSAWAAFHFVALVEAHRSVAWVAWWTLWTVSLRVVMVCVFNTSGRSVFAIALFHAVNNVGWQLFPVNGSYFDPRVSGLIAAVIAALVALMWGRERSDRAELGQSNVP